MRIRCGSTRLVLLVGDKAIKVGRFRPLNTLLRLLILPFSKKRREHFFEKYGNHFWQALGRDLCAGLYANRGEYEYYQESRNPLVMPTTARFLAGWVVVQPRGTSFSEEEFRLRSQGLQWTSLKHEMAKPEQFAKTSDDQIVLVDYGRKETREALEEFV